MTYKTFHLPLDTFAIDQYGEKIFNRIDLTDYEREISRNGKPRFMLSLERILILEALGRMHSKTEFTLFGHLHNSGYGAFMPGDGSQLDVFFKEEIIVFSGQSRYVAFPSVIFPIRYMDQAAEYFVWKVSEGTVKINWELFLDMEP
jgi:hypothetical protein